jgi:hypothetical protein
LLPKNQSFYYSLSKLIKSFRHGEDKSFNQEAIPEIITELPIFAFLSTLLSIRSKQLLQLL